MPLAFQQKQTFKNQPEQVVEEYKFNGGLVTDVHETKLAANQSPNLANVIADDTQNLVTRSGYLRYNGDPVSSSTNQSNTGASTGTVSLTSPSTYVAQTFQVGTLASILQVNAYLAMQNSGESQYVKVELWSGASGPSAHIADAQTILVSSTAETAYNFRFRVPQLLTATTEFALVIRPVVVQSTSQTTNTVLVHRTGTAYANGAAYESSDSGLTWSTIASIDLKFAVITGSNTGSTGLIRFYGDAGVAQTLAKFGTGYYRGNDSTGAMTAITMANGVTPASMGVVDYTVSNGTLLVVDQTNQILKYRGSTNGAYTTGTISVTNGSATVTGSGTSWSTTTNAEVGEYIQLPDLKWYRIVSIASNTSLTIEVSYYGSTASGQSYTISPWGVVQGRFNSGGTSPASESVANLVKPTPDFIENHINRIWTLKGNSLRFSVLDTSISGEHFNDWDTGSNAGEILIPSGNGDTGTGLYSLGNSLYIFQRRAIWRLYGNSPANFELRNVTNEIGMISQKTLVEWNDILIFLSDLGLIMFDGSNVKNFSEGVVNTFINDWADKTSPVATLWGNRYLINYTPSSSVTNSEALYYDLQSGTFWKITGVFASAWMTWAGGTDDGRLYFASSNQGSIYRWDIGNHDDGYPIVSLYDSPSLGFGAGINDKSLKRFYLQQLALGDWNMQTTMFTNISEVTTSGEPINLTPGSASLWDNFEWDVGSWSGEGALITTRLAEFQGQGRYFRFRMEQEGYGEGINVLGMIATARLRRLN